MAGTDNTLITAERIAPILPELLTRSLTLAVTGLTVPTLSWTGSSGDSVAVKVRLPRSSREQTTPGDDVTFDKVEETRTQVTVKHLYDAAILSDEDMTLGLTSFALEVLAPQVASIATAAEDQVGAVFNDQPADLDLTGDPADAFKKVLEARRILGRYDNPAGDRFLAVSPEVAEVLLDNPQLVKVNESGSPSALRDGTIGQLVGFTVVESNALHEGSAVAYHRSAFVFATHVPEQTVGAGQASAYADPFVAARIVLEFIPQKLASASIVSTFSGAALVSEDGTQAGAHEIKRLVKLEQSS